MCGIAGVVGLVNGVQQLAIQKMTETLTHRGPEQQAYWADGFVHFGHCRLSIVDIENGTQPIVRTVNEVTYVMIYNGEIYNAMQLKETLQQEGYTFTTTSDTEVLLYSFIHWRENCVNYIKGIFAFAIYVKEQAELFLFRDRVGVKPLFYNVEDGHFLFASEIKALLAFSNKTPYVTPEGLAMLLSIGPSRVPGKTVFESIYEIPPAHYLKITASEFTLKQYYKKEITQHTDSFSQTVKCVRELVTNAVEDQLMSDVPVCSFLSGGIDSSIISTLANQINNVQTFSLHFKENENYFKASSYQLADDRPWIEKVSTFIKTEHHYIEIDENQLFKALLEAMKAKDYPSMADIDSSLLLFSQEVSQQYKVALSGECADELFGGYPWFQAGHEAAERQFFPWITSINERELLLKKKWREKLQLKKTLSTIFEQAISKMPQEYNEAEKLYELNELYFMQTLLERKDRMSMATSLEVRVPFADDELVHYVWNIPMNMKQYGGVEKGLLREAFKGLLPDDVLYRKKNPFPKTHHPNFTKLVQQELKKRWNQPTSILRELFEELPFEQLIATGGNAFKKPWFGQLMTGPQLLAYFIQLDEWFTTYQIQLVDGRQS